MGCAGPIPLRLLMNVEFTRELIDRLDGFSQQPLRVVDFLFESGRLALGRLLQGQQPNVDAQQGLGDFIPQIVACLLYTSLRRRQRCSRDQPTLRRTAAEGRCPHQPRECGGADAPDIELMRPAVLPLAIVHFLSYHDKYKVETLAGAMGCLPHL